ncbi:MAG: MmcQ/YjbR family DNA-binding protein [Kofleriaceae bacterium]
MTNKRPIIPPRILGKLRAICLPRTGAYEEAAWTGTRWLARKRNFAHVVAIDDGWPPAHARAAGTDGPALVLTFRASGELSDALRTTGPPHFHAPWGTKWGTQVIGMVLGNRVRWDEVAILLGESHRVLATARPAGSPAMPRPRRRR